MLCLSLSASAPQIEWLKGQSSIEMEIPEEVVASKDGNLYFLNRFTSCGLADQYDPYGNLLKGHSITTKIYAFDFEEGSQHAIKELTGFDDKHSSNGSNNGSLLKMTPEGKLLWAINTRGGNCSGGNIAATSDGGALLHFKTSHSAKAIPEPSVLCRIIDAEGTETVVEWAAPDNNIYGSIYQPVFVKVSADGIVEWAKRIDVGYKREMTDDRRGDYGDNYEIYDMVADDASNVYIAGNYTTSINFGRKARFDDPHNIIGWKGGYTSAGDLFVVKFDLKTKFGLWGITTKSEGIEEEMPKALALQGDKLYLTGYMWGHDETTPTILGDIELVPTKRSCLFHACLTTADGSVDWAKIFRTTAHPVTDNGARVKTMTIAAHGDALYLAGSYYGNIYDGETLILENDNKAANGLLAFIVKVSATDGSFKNAVTIDGGLTEVRSVFPYHGKILASGYALYGSASLYELNEELELSSLVAYPLKRSGLSMSQGAAIIGDRLFTAMNTDSGFFINGLEWTPSGGNYSLVGRRNCLFLAHDLKPLLTDIDEPAATDVARPYLYDQTLHFPADMLGAEAAIYNTQGLLIERFTVTDALTHRLYDIPQGMIITLVVNGKGYIL